MAQYYTLVTDIGTKKIAEMIATGSKLNLVKLQLGDGGGAYYEPSTKQTALKNKVHEINVNSIKTNAENQNWLTIEGVVEAKVGGFYIREVGLFDDSNQLIAIAKYSETYKPLPSEGTAKELVIRVVIDIDNVDSINMSVNADISVATKDDIKNLEDDINELETKIDSIKINNNFQTATGTGTEITIDIDMDTIQNGDSFTFIASANNAGSATTINSKPVYKPNTTTPPNTTSGKAYTIWYNAPSDCFFVQASAEGNAPQSSVLAGATFSNDNDTGLLGTMNDLRSTNVYCGAEGVASLNVYSGNSAYGQLKITPSPNQKPHGYADHTTTFETHLLNLIPSNIKAGVSIAGKMTGTFTNDATAQAGHILSGQSAYVKGNKLTGTMANRGAVSSTLNAGGSYTIPAGYHNGSGKVTVNSLSSQTSATAVAGDIKAGKTAWVNGSKLTGTYDPLKLVAGTSNLIYSDDAESKTLSTSYTKIKSVTCTQAYGTVTVNYTVAPGVQNYGKTATSRVYINGVAKGIERSTQGKIESSENFTINQGDTIQIYGYSSQSNYSCSITNFRIYCGNTYSVFTKS